ncbi:MAG: hypothetical protein LQ338_002417 [Usnochroma carphineum]|nr:MAG: hypothetical protein LQ338_002417 [Usnochroma carphineum]
MVSSEEGTHYCTDGTELYTKTWKSSGDPIAKIVFIHGFSDHCNAYLDFFPTLASRQIHVYAFDQRGWGRSVKRGSDKGLTGPTSQVLDDINSVLKSQLPSTVPLFLMGHSMGGAEVLHYAAYGPRDIKSQISGYLCESPLVAIHEDTQPSKFVVIAGRLAAKVVPNRQMVQNIDPKFLCRDETLYKEFEADELCHDTGTLEGLAGMLQRAEDLDAGRVLSKNLEGCSLWVGHGTEDRVTSFKATARFMDRLDIKDKTFRVYEGHYHKLHAEPGEDKVQFANDVADWILARAGKTENTNNASSEARSRL